MGLPDRRKDTYEAHEARLDLHLKEVEDKLSKWLRLGLIAFTVIGLACTIAIAGFGIVLMEIQNQRFENCMAQNTRHDNTLRELENAQEEAIKKRPEIEDRIREGQEANEKIINAIAPKLNCEKIKRFTLSP